MTKPSTRASRRCERCPHARHPGKRCGAPVDATLFDPEGKQRCQCDHQRAEGDPS